MIGFIIVATLMLSLVMVLLLPTIIGSRQPDNSADDEALVRTLKNNLKTLHKRKQAGKLSDTEHDTLREQQGSALVGALGSRNNKPAPSTGGKVTAAILLLLIPVTTTLLYRHLGAPELLQAKPGAEEIRASMPDMIQRLEQRLTTETDDAEGWFMLGRAYMSQNQYPKAADAISQVYRIVGDDPTIMVQYADALAMANDGSMMGKPAELLAKALQIDPNIPEALWLSGIAASEQRNFRAAIAFWQRARPLLAEDEESAIMLEQAIADAESRLAQANSNKNATTADAPKAQAAQSIQLHIALSDEFNNKAEPETTVFIYARAASGPPMPLAAVKRQVKDLPLTVTLDDSMAMAPNMTLSAFKEIIVGARISSSGEATPQSGDLEGSSSVIDSTATKIPIKVVIDSLRP